MTFSISHDARRTRACVQPPVGAPRGCSDWQSKCFVIVKRTCNQKLLFVRAYKLACSKVFRLFVFSLEYHAAMCSWNWKHVAIKTLDNFNSTIFCAIYCSSKSRHFLFLCRRLVLTFSTIISSNYCLVVKATVWKSNELNCRIRRLSILGMKVGALLFAYIFCLILLFFISIPWRGSIALEYLTTNRPFALDYLFLISITV